jgi:hypothetical protein
MKRLIFIGLLVIVLILPAFSVSAQDNMSDAQATIAALQTQVADLEQQLATPAATATKAETPRPTPTAPVGTIDNPQNVGKSVTAGCVKLKLYGAQVMLQTGGFIGVSEVGKKYVVLDMEIKNACDQGTLNFNINSFFAQDTGNGAPYTDVIASVDFGQGMMFGTLDPGRKVRGKVAIKIAEEAQRVVIGYKADILGKQIIYFEVNVRS